MRRRDTRSLAPFDPEIERTLRSRRREQEMAEREFIPIVDNSSNNNNNNNDNNGPENRREQGGADGGAENQERSLRSYIMPTAQGIIRSIVPPPVAARNFEIKPALLQMVQNLLQFSGLPHEDPNQHLAKLVNICNTTQMENVDQDAILLRVFPFTLRDRAWNWLDSLPPNSITTWGQLIEAFLGKYFPPSKTGQLRNEITNFRQNEGESLYEAWERMKDMLRKCPHHGLSDAVTLQIFYQGTLPNTRCMLDAAAGGALMSLTYTAAYNKIEEMANNFSHNYGGERATPRKAAGVLEIDNISSYMAKLDATVKNLSKQLTNMHSGNQAQIFQVGENSHAHGYEDYLGDNQECYQEGSVGYEALNFVGERPMNNPYSNTYNPGWRNHPNFKWGNNNDGQPQMNQSMARQGPPGFQGQQFNKPYQGGYQQPYQQNLPPRVEQKSSLETMLEKYMKGQQQINQQHSVSIRNIEMQIGQLAQQLSNRPQGTLPGHTENNPKGENVEHCKAVHLRSGKMLPERVVDETPQQGESTIDEEVEAEGGCEKDVETGMEEEKKNSKTPYWSVMKPDLPFPNRVRRSMGGTKPDVPLEEDKNEKVTQKDQISTCPKPVEKAEEKRNKKKTLDKQFEKFLDVFKKLQINLPFAEALSQMPTYLKFMKEILSKKRKLSDYETIALSEHCSAVLSPNLPKKCKDPGSFNLPFTLGNFYSGMALCDLGASVNLMSLSVCKRLGLYDPSFFNLRNTKITLRMADHSLKTPVGVLEDVLVKVGKFILPADFIVLNMDEDSEDSIIFGRPFLATARASIDVEKGELTMRVQGEEENFNVLQNLEPNFEPFQCKVVSIAKNASSQKQQGTKVKKRKGPKPYRWLWKEKKREVVSKNASEINSRKSQSKKFANVLERFLDCW